LIRFADHRIALSPLDNKLLLPFGNPGSHSRHGFRVRLPQVDSHSSF
jgi:hypothetical protein